MQIICHLECKLKQRDTTTHLLEFLKSGTLTINAGEDGEWQKFLFLAGGTWKWYSHLEDSSVYKATHTPMVWDLFSLVLPKWVKGVSRG